MKTTLLALVAFSFLSSEQCHTLWGQAGLRESLERLDRDEDGRIGPDEITPLARPYLERIAKARRISLDRETRIEDYQEAARIYYALQNGVSGESVEADLEAGVKSFRLQDDQVLVPEFGLREVKFKYTQGDLEEADQTLRRYDRNDDGYIDRREAARGRWTHRDPFEEDLDQDGRLSRLEFAQGYARRRLLEGDADELVQRARRVGNGIERSDRDEDRDRRGDSEWWRKGGSSTWLAASILGRFDKNRNGRLEESETIELGMPIGRIDADRNGELSRTELQAYMEEQQRDVGDETDDVPGWFYELDADRDGQVSMREFTEEWTDEKLSQFVSMDLNEDGLLTSREVAMSKAMVGGSYANTTAEILPPKKTVISEIDVADDFVIGDLNVKLSITHSNVGFLDGYLTGPDGQRIELFTEIGGSGDHFEETIFDDQSTSPITKARPPFSGSFLPEGTQKRQPGLGHFTDKPAKGVWQLVIRGTRSERFGMLHSWELIFRPKDTLMDSLASDGLESDASNTNVSAIAGGPSRETTQSEDRDEEEVREKSYEEDGKAYTAKQFSQLDTEEQKERVRSYMTWVEEKRKQDPNFTQDPGQIKQIYLEEHGMQKNGSSEKKEAKRESKALRKSEWPSKRKS